MKKNKLNIILILGLAAIIGIIIVQVLWTMQAFNMEGKKFSQKVHITLLQVVDRLYEYNNNEFPLSNPINKISNDYYIVNVNNEFDSDLLEYCLKTEFMRANLETDFEYAIYKCESDEMVYGNYISFNDKNVKKASFHFPKQKGLIYYFAIRFPNEVGYLLGTLKLWLALTFILLLILFIYVYSVFTILQQKKYSELQKDFINNMTHEFKTPLSSILISATYLSKQDKIMLDDKLEKYTGMIIEQGNRLNDHIEKILQVARTGNDPLGLEMKEVAIVPLIRKVTGNLKLKYENTDVIIIAPNEDLTILADGFHLSNLVYNLVDNSIKYCLGMPEIIIRIIEEKRAVKLEFIDNGIGISEKHHSFIFEKFYRIPGNTNDVTGFGLGLYYVKKICTLHNWKISVNNNKDKGITVSILIPIKT